MKQYEVLEWAFSFLERYERERHVAELLLQHLTGMDGTQFYVQTQRELPPTIITAFKRAITEHALTGKPLQHITGIAHFYGREFIVNSDVLIPRFETEELVARVIDEVKQHLHHKSDQLTIVDLGTGSGVIAITLALELVDFNIAMYGTDISEAALHVARQNAEKHGVD